MQTTSRVHHTAAMGRPGVVTAPPADALALFSTDNPTSLFSGLEEIGHGNFGAVYQAQTSTGENVALKKMIVRKGFDSEEWNDIHKEILFMRSIEHANIVAFKGCYLSGLEVWLALEFCVGSALDVMEAIKSGLSEPQILCITAEVLKALAYLHDQEKMHRDIKAGNVLLAQNGEVKLADFGSASTKVKSNSFIGTPFWMAPEVIMAMETGTYTSLIDVWSLGIMCIEMATTTPPLFNMNAMSALYHIPQRDPPRLEGEEWSALFKEFIATCLHKDPESRDSASSLLQHPFVLQDHPRTILTDLLKVATNPELLEGNKQHLAESVDQIRQHIKEDTSSPEASPRESPLASPAIARKSSLGKLSSVAEALPEETAAALAAATSPKSEKAADCTDARANGSSGSASTRPPGSSSPSRKKKRKKKTGPLQEARAKRWETQKATLENQLIVAQLKQIKKVRKEQAKLIEALEAKHVQELAKLHGKQGKELESTAKSHDKEMERCLSKFKTEIDAWQKEDAVETKRHGKRAKQLRDKSTSDFSKSCVVSLKQAMVSLKMDAVNVPKLERKEMEQGLKEHYEQERNGNEQKLVGRLDLEAEQNERQFKTERATLLHALEMRHLNEEIALGTKHSKQLVLTRTAHVTASANARQAQHDERSEMAIKNLAILSQTELEQGASLTRDGLRDLEKRQASELKMQPSSFKESEQRLSKQFKSTVKVTEKQYRSSFGDLQKTTPLPSRTDTLRRHNTEKSATLLKLESEYKASVADMKRDANDSLVKRHQEEKTKFTLEHDAASTDLESYQNARSEVHKQQVQRATAELKRALKQENQDRKAFILKEEERCAKLQARVPELASRQDETIRSLTNVIAGL